MYLRVYQILVGLILGFKRKEKHRNLLVSSLLRCYNCGERGIRTPGTSRYDGFQDRCNRPLYHLSLRKNLSALDERNGGFLFCGCKDRVLFSDRKVFVRFFVLGRKTCLKCMGKCVKK